MTKNEYFYVLSKILNKACNEQANETQSLVLDEIRKLPNDCKVYYVSSWDGDILCTDKKMANDLWNSNPSLTEMYYVDTAGGCHSIKKRK